jgi:hypothetical protein
MTMESRFVNDGTHASESLIPMTRHGDTEQRHRPGVGARQAQQCANEGRLPCAIRPEVAECGAPGDKQLDIVNRDIAAEALGQSMRLYRPLAL